MTRQLTVATIAAVATLFTGSAASAKPSPQPTRHFRYVLKDLGTLGGPNSQVSPDGTTVFENARGVVVGAADTPNADPFVSQENQLFPQPDGYIQHAFLWRNGALTDLGALPGTTMSYAASVAENDVATGLSTTGLIDPLTGFIAGHAVLWDRNGLTDLGTLGGNESYGFQVNSGGVAVGGASNAIPNNYSYFGWGAQTRAFRWKHRKLDDLGTLGGDNAIALFVNERGQIVGLSDTTTMPNPTTGFPTQHPFLWDPHANHGKGQMVDAGTLGGTLVNGIAGLNERGEFVGQMSLADDQTFHGFKWDGTKLVDLKTFGGPSSNTFGINASGSVAGAADYPSGCSGPAQHATLWRDTTMLDLGVIPGTVRSVANGLNVRDQVVGYSFACDYSTSTAFLWERGHLYDLNTLIAPSSMYLYYALEINDRGEISGDGVINGQSHAYVLIPQSDGSGVNVAGDTTRRMLPVSLPQGVRRTLMQRSASKSIARYFANP